MVKRFGLLFNSNVAVSLCVLLLSLVFFSSCSEQPEKPKPKPKPVDKIIARVNGRPITRSLLERTLKVLLYHGDSAFEEKPKYDDEELSALKKSVLNELIEEEIVIEQALKEGVAIDPQELYDTVALIMGDTDEEAFNKVIVQLYGSLDVWREDLERKMLVARVVEGVKGSVKKITEWEASRHFIRNEEEYKVPEQVKAAMILVATKEEADKVKVRLSAGEDFAKLAKEFSISPEGAIGGELGVFSLGEMPREFEEVVFKIPLRVPSKVIKTGYGYHIFLVRERKKGRKLRFENVKIDIKAKLMTERTDQKLVEWILELKKQASIEILEEI